LEEIIKTCEKCTEKNILKGLGLPWNENQT
jgi:hypothetical protein